MNTKLRKLIGPRDSSLLVQRPLAILVMPDGGEFRFTAEELRRSYSTLATLFKALKMRFGIGRVRRSLTAYGATKFTISS